MADADPKLKPITTRPRSLEWDWLDRMKAELDQQDELLRNFPMCAEPGINEQK